MSGAVYLTQIADPTDHHIARRRPTFTGRERPLPDFGLTCDHCEEPLAGAVANACPACGQDFDLAAIVPKGGWVNIGDFVPASVAVVAKTLLYDAEIPYLVDNSAVDEVVGSFKSSRLRVPREFFFDALNVLATSVEAGPDMREDWTCPSCNESVPAGFEVCWNCNAARPGEPQGDID